MSDEKLKELLERYKKILVIGISDKPARASFGVSQYMQSAGYQLTGVNPKQPSVLGMPMFGSLGEVPLPLEIVDVFRASEHVAAIVDELIPMQPKLLWLQEGVSDPVAEKKAKEAGIEVISNRCILKEHRRLL